MFFKCVIYFGKKTQSLYINFFTDYSITNFNEVTDTLHGYFINKYVNHNQILIFTHPGLTVHTVPEWSVNTSLSMTLKN